MNKEIYAAADCHPAISLYDLREIAEEVRQTYFSQIPKYSIELHRFESEDIFLQTAPVISSLVNDRYFRKYKLQYNPRLLACPPSRDALIAILVHEFEHIKDYHEFTLGQLSNLLVKYVTSKKFVSNYERSTDVKACKKGQARGLKEYRLWQKQFLNPKQLATKRRNYLTPEELTKLE